MQINTDISPIISPKSNLSNSFMSPRDAIFMNLHSNRTGLNIINNYINDNPNIKSSEAGLHKIEFEFSNNVNSTTTNESYSIERLPLGKVCLLILKISHIFVIFR